MGDSDLYISNHTLLNPPQMSRYTIHNQVADKIRRILVVTAKSKHSKFNLVFCHVFPFLVSLHHIQRHHIEPIPSPRTSRKIQSHRTRRVVRPRDVGKQVHCQYHPHGSPIPPVPRLVAHKRVSSDSSGPSHASRPILSDWKHACSAQSPTSTTSCRAPSRYSQGSFSISASSSEVRTFGGQFIM